MPNPTNNDNNPIVRLLQLTLFWSKVKEYIDKIKQRVQELESVKNYATYDGQGNIISSTYVRKRDERTRLSQFDNDVPYLTAKDIEGKADRATTLAGYGITDAYTTEQSTQIWADAVAALVRQLDEIQQGTIQQAGDLPIVRLTEAEMDALIRTGAVSENVIYMTYEDETAPDTPAAEFDTATSTLETNAEFDPETSTLTLLAEYDAETGTLNL